jgi:uncharacterized membrane protein
VTLYRICIVLHVAAASLWLGHMFFWSLFSGPVLKSIEQPAGANRLRELSLRMGGLGWPALATLAATGVLMLPRHGVTWEVLASGGLLEAPFGRILTVKLLLVLAMVGYQVKFAHGAAQRAIHWNIAAALLVLAASTLLSA